MPIPPPEDPTGAERSGPFRGIRVLELAGIGPCPFAAMVLADLGADVLRLERPEAVTGRPAAADVLQRGKRSIGLDLKASDGVELALELVERADVLLEGFRPGVTERLGLGPDACLGRNGRLVYGRMTGWGQDGPLAGHVGHDIDYIALAGVLGLFGRSGEAPVPPCNLVGDFGGGGMLLALGVAGALFEVARGGPGQVVDAAMVDGAALLSTMVWSFAALGLWREERGTNLLDTGAPFYEVYECADGRHLAVGALEPHFYEALCRLTGLEEADLPPQMARQHWPETKARFAEVFRTKPRDEWVDLADTAGGDACVAPVLALHEAARHPHNAARQTFLEHGGVMQPAPAPRLSRTPGRIAAPPCSGGEGGRAALEEWGVLPDRTEPLAKSGVLRTL